MTAPEWPKLFRDTKGIRVRTKFPLSNGNFEFPVGVEGVIEGGHNWRAIQFRADPCACCGVAARISRVDKYFLEPIG